MKRIVYINLVKLFVLVVSLTLCISLSACGFEEPTVYMFADIDECNNIVLQKSDDAVVEVYDSPDKDKYLKDLEYDSFYACKYKSDDLKFKLFAYDFVDKESAQEYFERCADRDCVGDTDFLTTRGMMNYEVRVRCGDCAYILYTRSGYQKQVDEYLSNLFTVDVTLDNMIDSLASQW